MNYLIRHQQVVTEAAEEEKEERLISSQLHRGGVGDAPAADNGSLSPPLTYTRKHTLTIKTLTHIHTGTHFNFRALVFPLPSWTTTGFLRVDVFVCQQLQFITKQNRGGGTMANLGILRTQWRTHLSFIHLFRKPSM